MLSQVEDSLAQLPSDEVLLIGSSLGGFVAVEAAARLSEHAHHPVSRLVLLAPAVELEWEKWSEIGPGGVEAWRQAGSVEVFHYAFEELRRLNFAFYEDAVRYQPGRRRLSQPSQIFQGRFDASVTPAVVERFASRQPNATLLMLDDGHQLKDSLEIIWEETARIIK
jgi:pimeloyl-ACP methyl ester carboxylesterase